MAVANEEKGGAVGWDLAVRATSVSVTVTATLELPEGWEAQFPPAPMPEIENQVAGLLREFLAVCLRPAGGWPLQTFDGNPLPEPISPEARAAIAQVIERQFGRAGEPGPRDPEQPPSRSLRSSEA